MQTRSIILPATLAVAIVTARALSAKTHRMPYPYEYASVAVIYGGAGLVGELSDGVGAAVAWGYLVALVLAPSSANLLTMFGKAVGSRGTPPLPSTPTTQGGAAQ
jgi:hypothetical protein